MISSYCILILYTLELDLWDISVIQSLWSGLEGNEKWFFKTEVFRTLFWKSKIRWGHFCPAKGAGISTEEEETGYCVCLWQSQRGSTVGGWLIQKEELIPSLRPGVNAWLLTRGLLGNGLVVKPQMGAWLVCVCVGGGCDDGTFNKGTVVLLPQGISQPL